MIALIVAKASNNVIGSKNDLPWYLPADLKHFKDVTTGHTVVMGKNTFESIINRINKPLPNRQNIVITRDESFSYPGVTVIHDLDKISELGDIFIIGGAEIYNQTINLADRLYVTEVRAEIDGDVYFPEIGMHWIETSREKHTKDDKNQFDYDFVIYKKKI